ncbi:MAG: amidohydrolase family protein, partial [Pseudorhodoplanes sp.]
MAMKLKVGATAAIACAALFMSDIRMTADAHGVHRPRIGASHKTPSGAPETWGTYCITELAPLFREAILLAQANQPAPGTSAPAPAADAVTSQPPGTVNIKPLYPVPTQAATPQPSNIPLLKPLPPSMSDKPQQTTEKMTIFVARKIVTMDPGWPTATAVAVKDGRILSVGTLEDLQPWMKRFPYDIDRRFAKQVIYPGFVEAHGHPVMGSVAISLPPLTYFPLRNPYGPDFPGVKTRDDATKLLRKYVKEAKPGSTVLTWGYDVVAMGGDLLNRDDLDAISKDQPIIVWDASEHYVFANSAAIQKYGITNELVAKTIGAGKNPDGSSNGQFLGTEAAKIIMLKPLAEVLTPEEGMRRLRYLGALMQQAGITATGDLFYGGVNLELENLLTRQYFGQPNSIARIVHVADGATFSELYGERAVAEAIRLRTTSNERLIFNGVKFYADDAFVSLGMELQYPGYIDNKRFKGLF